jgi:CHASE2 domain-containing sensor protein
MPCSTSILDTGSAGKHRTLSRLFISHASANNVAAVALRDWLTEQGFDDVFLDIDPDRGIAPGERWQEAFRAASDRCEAVLCLVSPAWLDSRWCLAEFLLAKSLNKRIFGIIVEVVPFERLPVEMTAEWQLCELVGEDRFHTFEVQVFGKPERIAFREAGLELLRRGLDRAGLDARRFPWPPAGEPNRAPYRGLKSLEAQDAAIFFGRDAAIVRGIDRIRGLVETGVDDFLIILGASGSGKSSFLGAGLWPRLARNDANFLALPVIRPQTAVISGSTGLAAALAAAFERLGAPRPPGRIKEALAGDNALGRLLDELLALAKRRRLVAVDNSPAGPAIVLPLDQAEELFNPDGVAEAGVFLDLLSGVLAHSQKSRAQKFLVVATMRSDRYGLLQNDPRLADVKRNLFDLPPIPQTEFKSIIEGPARRVVEAGGRLTIDPALTERLIADAQGADALPLLGFTLERLYTNYGSGGRLTIAEYEGLGGVQGSIEAAVANAFAEPGRSPAIPAEKEAQLAALRAAFIPWLARIDPDTGAPMRRAARFEDIPQPSRGVIERLIDARLLIADRRAGTDVIEVVHESLLRQWQKPTMWLDADAADLKLVEGVERAAAEWSRNGRLEPWLDHRSDRLMAAERLVARDDFRLRLGDLGAAYLAACGAREEVERQVREEVARIGDFSVPERPKRYLQALGSAVTFAVLAVALLLHVLDIGVVAELRLRGFDLEQHLWPRTGDPARVAIVDIDEKSLAQYGQWPWSWHLVAKLVRRIAQGHPRVLGIDIVFAERDRLSPAEIARELPGLPPALADALAQLPPGDRDLAEAMAAAPTVLALAPSREQVATSSGPIYSAPIHQAGDDPTPFLKSYKSLVQSQPDLRTAALAAGESAVEPDADGVVRRLALAVAHRQTIVPSFALEVVRVGGGERSIVIDTGPLGIKSIRIGGTTIPTDRRGRAILHFAPSLARYISASDVLNPAFDPAELQGQVVLLGVAGAGIVGLRQTPLGLVRAVDLHAQLIESILLGTLLRRPPYLDWFEPAAALAAGLAVIWLLRHARPVPAVTIATALAVALLGIEFALFRFAGLLFDSTFPALTLLAALGVMLVASLRAAKKIQDHLERLYQFSKRLHSVFK